MFHDAADPHVGCILPPHVLEHIAKEAPKDLRDAAFDTMRASERLRGVRQALAAGPLAATSGGLRRAIYDAKQKERLPGDLVRGEGAPAPSDDAVNEAYDGLGATYVLYAEVFRRRSIDGQGMPLDATVHYGRKYMNAFWDGRRMVFGDGDGKVLGRFTRCLDVVGHELTHGVVQGEAALVYEDQPGALNESMADVFGSLVKQFHRKETAREADWLIGDGLLVALPGQALRSSSARAGSRTCASPRPWKTRRCPPRSATSSGRSSPRPASGRSRPSSRRAPRPPIGSGTSSRWRTARSGARWSSPSPTSPLRSRPSSPGWRPGPTPHRSRRGGRDGAPLWFERREAQEPAK